MLGPECKVVLKKFHGLGTSKKNPAKSCKQIHDVSLKDDCDLLNGGWTLVGKVSGFVDELHTFWLIEDYNVNVLDSPALPRYIHYTYLCVYCNIGYI